MVLLFAVVGALLLVLLDWYVAPTKPSDKKDLVLALAQILAGTASWLASTSRGAPCKLTAKGRSQIASRGLSTNLARQTTRGTNC